MASPAQDLEAFAQKVHLVIKNRYFDEIDEEDGQIFIKQVIDWTNMYLDELEDEQDPSGQVVDWWFNRESEYALGTATEGAASIQLPRDVDRVITDEQRYVKILQGDSTVSWWLVVQPGDISNRENRVVEDMCSVVGNNLVFSRAFKDTENSGSIVGDVQLKTPRLTYSINTTDNFTIIPTNIKVLTTVRPQTLLQLGVAKNATLPDIVQGGLSPSYVQKYTNLLNGAIARSMSSSISSQATRDSYGYIGGV